MKKLYYIFINTIFIILIIVLIKIKTINNYQNIEYIKNSIVKIIPENTLIKYSNNPIGILEKNKYGIGSGFFINKNGTIITSLHNISNKNINYYAITCDKQKYKISIIKKDFQNDLAIIKITTKTNYNYLEINYYKNYIINDKIYSFGIKGKENQVSYKTGLITNINNFIEFNPKIEEGFSGGPIIDSNFKVIGINYGIKTNNSYGIVISNFKFLLNIFIF